MTVDDEVLNANSDDDDIPENVHNRLLTAVSQLYKKKRVEAPKRKEPTLQVSEFHLTGVEDEKKGKIILSDLTRVLGKRAGHAEIGQQIQSAKRKSTRLPKPLEKPEAEKIQRTVGYENLKKDFNKWNAIVQHHRVAEQVSFPLAEPKLHIHEDTTDFLSTFKTATPLEKEIAAVLNASKASNNETEELDEPSIPMTLEEMKEQRKLMFRIRAQQRYKEVKAARQNKIKSKRYHRIQRKEKMKAELKEFEELQRTDPEAALNKLEKLEKVRAQERASLRHRTTGQWARNLQVRAKYDKEARIALSEQLQQSRELTRKLKNDNSSDDEDFNNADELRVENSSDKNNPWTENNNKNEVSEVQEFYSNYRKFWEENKKAHAKNNTQTKIDGNKNNVNTACVDKPEDNTSCNSINLENTFNERLQERSKSKDFISFNISSGISSSRRKSNDVHGKNVKDKVSFSVLKKYTPKPTSNVITSETGKDINFKVTSGINCPTKLTKANSKSRKRVNDVSFSVLKRYTPASTSKIVKSKSEESASEEMPTQCGMWSVSSIDDNSHCDSSAKCKKTKKIQKAPGDDRESKRLNGNSSLNFDDMFYEVEDKLQEKFQKRVGKLKESLEKSLSQGENNEEIQDEDLSSGLEMKRAKVTADIDEALSENPTDDIDNGPVPKSIEKSLALSKTLEKNDNAKQTDIEPIRTFQVKPKYLKTQVPTNLVGEENLDDDDREVDGAQERHFTIAEAFADDDVVKEFQREKDEEIEKSKVEDVNLVLPGWGTWAGHNIKQSKHKKKRFIFKFPKVFPRRDENKGNVVINEDKDESVKPHLVSELPFPFTSVKDYEASIRTPLGATWMPQKAHRKLTAPAVITRMGTIIEPMTEDVLVNDKQSRFK